MPHACMHTYSCVCLVFVYALCATYTYVVQDMAFATHLYTYPYICIPVHTCIFIVVDITFMYVYERLAKYE